MTDPRRALHWVYTGRPGAIVTHPAQGVKSALRSIATGEFAQMYAVMLWY